MIIVTITVIIVIITRVHPALRKRYNYSIRYDALLKLNEQLRSELSLKDVILEEKSKQVYRAPKSH